MPEDASNRMDTLRRKRHRWKFQPKYLLTVAVLIYHLSNTTAQNAIFIEETTFRYDTTLVDLTTLADITTVGDVTTVRDITTGGPDVSGGEVTTGDVMGTVIVTTAENEPTTSLDSEVTTSQPEVTTDTLCNMQCTTEIAELCGSDGLTYINECYFLNAVCLNPALQLVSNTACPNDIDECATNQDNCIDTSTTCSNTVGSFECVCLPGFTATSSTTSCDDNNECTSRQDQCDDISTMCINTMGSYQCSCKSGFTQSGVPEICIDIDECTLNTDNCNDVSTTCSNTAGSFDCVCRSGFVQQNDPSSCDGVCDAGQNPCDTTSTVCLIVSGASTCVCLDGFQTGQDSLSCDPIPVASCCPFHANSVIRNRLYISTGRCVYLDSNILTTFDNFPSECVASTSTYSLAGGRLLELSNVGLDQGLRNFILDKTPSSNLFPDVFVDFRLVGNNYVWNTNDNVILQNNDADWLGGGPTVSTGNQQLECGAIAGDGSSIGYVNTACDVKKFGFCSVDLAVCTANQALSSRMVIPIQAINNQSAVRTRALTDPKSSEFIELQQLLCGIIDMKIPEEKSCRTAGTADGSIIAYMEVNFTRPNTFRNADDIKAALLYGSELDSNGYTILRAPDGQVISIRVDTLEIDDLEKYMCQADQCQNGGSCYVNDRFIQAECLCTAGFQGVNCETIAAESIIVSSSSTSFIVLAIIATALLIIFVLGFCCACVACRRQMETKNRMTYRYRSPVQIPAPHRPRRQLYDDRGHRQVIRNPRANLDTDIERSIAFPRVIRNIGLTEDDEISHVAPSSMDDKRMANFEQAFLNNRLNSHMSSRGDGSVVASSNDTDDIAKTTYIEDAMDEYREFETPYTADGTTNV